MAVPRSRREVQRDLKITTRWRIDRDIAIWIPTLHMQAYSRIVWLTGVYIHMCCIHGRLRRVQSPRAEEYLRRQSCVIRRCTRLARHNRVAFHSSHQKGDVEISQHNPSWDIHEDILTDRSQSQPILVTQYIYIQQYGGERLLHVENITSGQAFAPSKPIDLDLPNLNTGNFSHVPTET